MSTLLEFDWEDLKQTLLQIENDSKEVQNTQAFKERVIKNKIKLLDLLRIVLSDLLTETGAISFTYESGVEVKLSHDGWEINGDNWRPIRPEHAELISFEDLEMMLIPFFEKKVPKVAGRLLEAAQAAKQQREQLSAENDQILKLINLIELYLV